MIRQTPKEPYKGLKRTPMKRRILSPHKKPDSTSLKAIRKATSKLPPERKPRKVSFISTHGINKRKERIKVKPQRISFIAKIPLPKKRKTARLDPLDVLFSEYIRKRAVVRVGGCERCLTPHKWQDLQNSHYFGRTDKSTRWDEDDCAGICGGCHLYLEHHPLAHTQWFEKHLGTEAFEMLQGRNRITYPKPDKKMIEIYLRAKIKEIDSENNYP